MLIVFILSCSGCLYIVSACMALDIQRHALVGLPSNAIGTSKEYYLTVLTMQIIIKNDMIWWLMFKLQTFKALHCQELWGNSSRSRCVSCLCAGKVVASKFSVSVVEYMLVRCSNQVHHTRNSLV